MRIDAIRAFESPYQQLELNGTKIVVNHFKFRMHNQSRETKIISIKPKQEFIEAGVEFTTALPEVSIQSGQSQKVDGARQEYVKIHLILSNALKC